MKTHLSYFSYFAIGFMLFALFFGAGNLIFPAQLGQHAGMNIWPAITGFLLTGVGLPLLGILAMAFSGTNNLQELASRVHPIYGVFFTSLLYLTIGPFFAAPRTATVAYEVGITPFFAEDYSQIGLLIFSIMFFTVALLFSLFPAKIVDSIGKILAPVLVLLLVVLLAFTLFKPIGKIESPQEAYLGNPFIRGFLEGYNTMDALASLVFGIIVIQVVRSMGVISKKDILVATAKSGTIAIVLLGTIYVGIAYLGATSTEIFGILDNGGMVLSNAAAFYFGNFGSILLAIVIILACLTTAIGLITANAEYFHTLFSNISYRAFVVFFSVITFIVANFGLNNIITYSIPILMFLYPLAIVLILLAFSSPLFHHAQIVYVSAIGVTLLISIFDGITSFYRLIKVNFPTWLDVIIQFYDRFLPLYEEGLGWLIPSLMMIIISGILAYFNRSTSAKKL